MFDDRAARNESRVRKKKAAFATGANIFPPYRIAASYELSPQFLIHISKEEGRLFAQATGQNRFEIFPESDGDFFLRGVDAVLTLDAESPVSATQLILHQNGVDRVGSRKCNASHAPRS